MTKLPKEIPNPFEHRDQLRRMEKVNAKQKQFNDRIQEIIKGERPKDPMSWEHYIWISHHDPLRIK